MSEDARRILRERAGTRVDETLPSGLTVTIRIPKLQDCIVAGRVPLPILEHLVEVQTAQNGDKPELTQDDIAEAARYKDETVRLGVVAIEGEPIEMTLEDVREFSQADYDHILEVCHRVRNPIPAGSPT